MHGSNTEAAREPEPDLSSFKEAAHDGVEFLVQERASHLLLGGTYRTARKLRRERVPASKPSTPSMRLVREFAAEHRHGGRPFAGEVGGGRASSQLALHTRLSAQHAQTMNRRSVSEKKAEARNWFTFSHMSSMRRLQSWLERSALVLTCCLLWPAYNASANAEDHQQPQWSNIHNVD
jgi:hypothetical protein